MLQRHWVIAGWEHQALGPLPTTLLLTRHSHQESRGAPRRWQSPGSPLSVPTHPIPSAALFRFLWWFLARVCWFQLGLGWSRPAHCLHFVVWPRCYQMFWDFSGPGAGETLLQAGPKAWLVFRGKQETRP